MPTLFYTPGACSLSPHIALREAGLPFELSRVDLRTKKLADGTDYALVNPKGYVPALLLESGQLLTEGVAIVQYVADQSEVKLAPVPLDPARYVLQEWLTYISSELHKNVGTLFGGAPEAYKETIKTRIEQRLVLAEEQLGKHDYLLGADFTVADGYLFWVLRTWTAVTKRALTPNLQTFHDRVGARPAVKEAIAAEGLKT